jgi:hypothetical protein
LSTHTIAFKQWNKFGGEKQCEIYFADYEWAFESVEEATQICQDCQQQGWWSGESVEIGLLCNPIVKDSGMPHNRSEQYQGICAGDEETSTVDRRSFAEKRLG